MNAHHDEAPIVHWIVVADAARAQLLSSGLMLEELQPVEARVHPESRLPVHDLVSGDRGATRDGATGIKTRFERHHEPHRGEADAFAREVAAAVCAGRAAGYFQRLVLVAPPHFLGELRNHLDRETMRTVVASIHHEWTRLPLPELAERIRAALPTTLAES